MDDIYTLKISNGHVNGDVYGDFPWQTVSHNQMVMIFS